MERRQFLWLHFWLTHYCCCWCHLPSQAFWQDHWHNYIIWPIDSLLKSHKCQIILVSFFSKFDDDHHNCCVAAEHSEIWRLATSMEDHKSEIEDWDLGAGIYISFYVLRSSLQEDNDTISEMVWKYIWICQCCRSKVNIWDICPDIFRVVQISSISCLNSEVNVGCDLWGLAN